MLLSARIVEKPQLRRSPSILELPHLNTSHQSETYKQNQDFFTPVLRTKRYNLIKLYQLKHHQERDRRLGRVQNDRYRIKKLAEGQVQLINNSLLYHQQRQERCRKILNSSFINLNEKLKQSNRYCSIDK